MPSECLARSRRQSRSGPHQGRSAQRTARALSCPQVVKGWEQAVIGMRLGEQRIVTIPAHEGYGAAGFPAWGIPPGGTLNFTLECLKVE